MKWAVYCSMVLDCIAIIINPYWINSVKFHIFKVGTFKDFVEPYTRNDMSEASKQHNTEWMSELWGLYTNRVETQRKLKQAVSIN